MYFESHMGEFPYIEAKNILTRENFRNAVTQCYTESRTKKLIIFEAQKDADRFITALYEYHMEFLKGLGGVKMTFYRDRGKCCIDFKNGSYIELGSVIDRYLDIDYAAIDYDLRDILVQPTLVNSADYAKFGEILRCPLVNELSDKTINNTPRVTPSDTMFDEIDEFLSGFKVIYN